MRKSTNTRVCECNPHRHTLAPAPCPVKVSAAAVKAVVISTEGLLRAAEEGQHIPPMLMDEIQVLLRLILATRGCRSAYSDVDAWVT